jgi:hypothetical protein
LAFLVAGISGRLASDRPRSSEVVFHLQSGSLEFVALAADMSSCRVDLSMPLEFIICRFGERSWFHALILSWVIGSVHWVS